MASEALIAWKWVESLSEEQQSVLISGSIKRLQSIIATALTAARAETWKEAIAIARDYSQVAGSNAFQIRDRYGDESANEEELEFVGQAMADKIVKALEAAAGSKVFSREDEQKNSENQESVK